MRRFLCDTSVFVYVLGAKIPYREPCREIMQAAIGELQGEASGRERIDRPTSEEFRRGPALT